MGYGLDVKRNKVGDVVLVEGLSILGEDDIAVVGDVGASQAQAIPPQVFFLFGGAAISLFLVGGAFDAQAAIRVACRLQIGVVALCDVLAQIVLSDIGINMGHVE